LTFNSKKTVGKTTAVVEMLKANSSLVSEPLSDEVYRYFNIWIGDGEYATPANIENPVVCFKVEKSWLEDKNINWNSIKLNTYSAGEWKELPVNLTGEDNNFLYFTAQPLEFPFFAITGKSEGGIVGGSADSQPSGSDARGFNVENSGTINNANVEIALEKKATAPGFETIYGLSSLLVLFLYRKMKP
jgi:PGF-pre-PGF domain-containing protein